MPSGGPDSDMPFIAAAIARFEADVAKKPAAESSGGTSAWKRSFRWAQHHRRPA
jgi:hypothetical protein